MSDDMEYRVEVMDADADSSGRWYASSGSVQYDMESAERELDAVRSFYTDKTKPLRIASRPKQAWTPVPTRLEQAIERVEAALNAHDSDGYIGKVIIHYGEKRDIPLRAEDIRLVLNTVKEDRK